MEKLLFGTAGVPHSSVATTTDAGIARIRELGLDCMEMEFVHGVKMKPEMASTVKKVADKSKVVLTAHGPYYINLAAKEKAKLDASRKRVIDTATIGHLAGAYSITFHAAFYMGRDPAKIHEMVKKELGEIMRTISDQGHEIWVRPETMGKGSQYGTLEEILLLSQEFEWVMPCVDFSHIHARYQAFNTYNEFRSILEKIEEALGKEGIRNMHIHLSGIEYTDKGERRHVDFEEADMNYTDVLKALKEFEASGCVICESPSLEDDTILLKKYYSNL
jgi:deoxyribonuclease-4